MMRVLATLFFAVIVSACSTLHAGTVIDKAHQEGYYRTVHDNIYVGEDCYGSGSTKSCYPRYISVPRQEWVPPQWNLRIRGNCDDNPKCEEAWKSVTEDMYNRTKVGDWYEEIK